MQTRGLPLESFVSRVYGFDRDFNACDDDLYLSQHKLVTLAQRLWDKIRGHHYAGAEMINERAFSWVDSLPDGELFFVWNHYMDIHGFYEPPESNRGEFVDKPVSDSEAQDLYDCVGRAQDHQRHRAPVAP